MFKSTKKVRLLLFMCLVLASLALSACHEEDFVFHLITPEAIDLVPTVTPHPEAPIDEPDVVPEEETGELEPVPTPEPPCVIVKGNISRDGRKLYHLPGMPNYDQVKINEEEGEMFFCSEQAAIDAGFDKAGN